MEECAIIIDDFIKKLCKVLQSKEPILSICCKNYCSCLFLRYWFMKQCLSVTFLVRNTVLIFFKFCNRIFCTPCILRYYFIQPVQVHFSFIMYRKEALSKRKFPLNKVYFYENTLSAIKPCYNTVFPKFIKQCHHFPLTQAGIYFSSINPILDIIFRRYI